MAKKSATTATATLDGPVSASLPSPRSAALTPRVIASRADLLDALATACAVAPDKGVRPILSNVILRFSNVAPVGSIFELFATDLDMGVRLTVAAADVEIPGGAETVVKVALNARKLAAFVKAIESDKIEIALDDGVRISGGKTAYRMVTSAADSSDFPETTHLEARSAAALASQSVPGDALAVGLARTSWAALAKPGARYALDGVCFDWKKVDGAALKLVATDGKAMPVQTVRDTAPRVGETIFKVVHTRGVAALKSFCDGAETIGVAFDEVRATFTRGAIDGAPANTLSVQLLAGFFPPYEAAIPSSFAYSVDIGRNALHAIISRAALVTSTDSKGVTLTFSHRKVSAAARTPETGDGAAEVACEWEHEDFVTCLDPNYVLPTLNALGDDVPTVRIKFARKEGDGPAVFESATDAATDGLTVSVMPISLD